MSHFVNATLYIVSPGLYSILRRQAQKWLYKSKTTQIQTKTIIVIQLPITFWSQSSPIWQIWAIKNIFQFHPLPQ